MFLSGHAVASFEGLERHGLLASAVPGKRGRAGVQPQRRAAAHALEGLRGTDARVAADEPVSPAFLFALLLWPAYCRALMALQAQGVHAAEAQRRAADRVTLHQLTTHRAAAAFLAADAGDLAAAVALHATSAQARGAHARASAFPRRFRFPGAAPGGVGRTCRGHRVLAGRPTRSRQCARPCRSRSTKRAMQEPRKRRRRRRSTGAASPAG